MEIVSNKPINPNDVYRLIKADTAGSVVIHFAVVRGATDDKSTSEVEFRPSKDNNDIKREMRDISDEIRKKFKVDIDTQPLPLSFESSKFDMIVSSSMIEHCFYPENTIREGAKVLKNDGKCMIMVSNIGHWKFRLWLLFGRFPYLEGTPTDMLHLRFLTVHSLKEIGKKYGLDAKNVEGHPGLWVSPLYSRLFMIPPIKQTYELLTKIYPSLFARYILITFEKKKESKI